MTYQPIICSPCLPPKMNSAPPTSMAHAMHHNPPHPPNPAEMALYAQVHDKNNPVFNLMHPASMGFHHSPFSLVPNPTANPLLHQQQTEEPPPLPPPPVVEPPKRRIKSEAVEGDSAGVSMGGRGKGANSMRDKQKIIFDAGGKKLYACTLCDFSTKQKGQLKVC